jgi:hypothetical protein
MQGNGSLADCEDPTTALTRAQALVEGTTAPGKDSSFWAAHASRYLAAYLRAAALSGNGTSAVARWARGEDPEAPEAILMAAQAQQWSSWLAELRDGRTPQTERTVRLVMLAALGPS